MMTTRLLKGRLKWTPLSRQKSMKVKLVYIHILWKTSNGKTKPCGKPTETFIHKCFQPVENLLKTCGWNVEKFSLNCFN